MMLTKELKNQIGQRALDEDVGPYMATFLKKDLTKQKEADQNN